MTIITHSSILLLSITHLLLLVPLIALALADALPHHRLVLLSALVVVPADLVVRVPHLNEQRMNVLV